MIECVDAGNLWKKKKPLHKVRDLEHNLITVYFDPAVTISHKAGPFFQIISDTLNSTSQELHDLKKIYKVVKVNSRCRHPNNNINSNRRRRISGGGNVFTTAASAASGSPSSAGAGVITRKLSSLANSRRRRVLKMAVIIHLLLVSVVFLAWLAEPACCDSYTPLSFGPQLRYVNGPPPI